MGIVQSLSLIAVKQVTFGATRALGVVGVEAVARFLGDHFGDNSRRLSLALQSANSRAWNAVEVALAGESLWNKLDDGDDKAFRQQLRSYLDLAPLGDTPARDPEFRTQCLRELRAARKSGLLLGTALQTSDLAQQASELVSDGDVAGLLAREWAALDQVAALLKEAGHTSLARLVALRPGGNELPLIAVAVRYFFRRAVEQDAELYRGLSFAQWEAIAENQQHGFEQLGRMLDAHSRQLDEMLDVLGEVRGAVLDLRREISGQREQIKQLAHDVLSVLNQHQLAQRELRGGDSLSIRTDDERRLVRDIVARYRSLPPEQRENLPALLNAVGKMEVVAGNFDEARRDFKELVQLVGDEHGKAEASYNAYQAALECRQWGDALEALRQAVALDPERFSPFPMSKYEPERILGAGGFGVAYLCKDRHTQGRVVVKALRADGLDRTVTEVFAEARTLEEVRDEDIIRLRHCDYAGAGNARPYLVMDYFEGTTLADHVSQNGPLTANEAVALLGRVARALHKAHEKGVCHRDVKPANLLIRKGNDGWQVRLIDFGLALRQQVVVNTLGAASSYTQTVIGSSIAGTLDYAAPEQLGKRPGDKIGPHSDVYGLGKTACFTLFGTTMPLARHWRNVSPELADLLGQCLADDPRERPASCKEVMERLTGHSLPVAIPVETRKPEVAVRSVKEEENSPKVDPRLPLVYGGVLGAVAGLLASGPRLWTSNGPSIPLLLLVVGTLTAVAATFGQRVDRGSNTRSHPYWVLLLVCLLVGGFGAALLVQASHPYGPPLGFGEHFLLCFSVLQLFVLIAYFWGKLLYSSAGVALALTMIAAIGCNVPAWSFLFGAALIGGTVAAAFAVADPLRNLDRAIYRLINGVLDSCKPRLFGEVRLPVAKDAIPAPSSSFSLIPRLLFVTAGCVYLGMMLGTSSGATGFQIDYRALDTLWVITCTAAAAGGIAVALSRRSSFLSTLCWLAATAALSVGVFALATAIGWVWAASPVALGIALSVAGGILGLLAGVHHGNPITGAAIGIALSGTAVVGGILLGNPDTGAILGVSLGLFAGVLLWRDVRKRVFHLASAFALLLVGLSIMTVVIFRSSLGTPVVAFQHPQSSQVYYFGNQSGKIAVRPDGERLLTSDSLGVHLWDARTHRTLDSLPQRDTEIGALGFFNNLPLVLVSGPSTWYVRNVETGQNVVEVKKQNSWDYGKIVGVSHSGVFVILERNATAVAGEEYRLHVADPEPRVATTYKLAGKPSAYSAVALSPDNRTILLGSEDGSVYRGTLSGGGGSVGPDHETKKLSQRVTQLDFSTSGKLAVALSAHQPQSSVLVWNVAEWRDFANLTTGTAYPTCAAISPDDLQVLIGTDQSRVQRWLLATRTVAETYSLHRSLILNRRSPIGDVAYLSRNGMEAVSLGQNDGGLLMWDVRPKTGGPMVAPKSSMPEKPKDGAK